MSFAEALPPDVVNQVRPFSKGMVATAFGFGVTERRCVKSKNMPEDKTNPAAEAGAEGTGAGEGQPEGADDKTKTNATDTGGEDAGEGEGTKEGGEGANQPDTSKGQEGTEAKAPPKDTSKDDDADDGTEPEIRPRLSTKDFIIQRQQRKLSKGPKAGEEGDEAEEGDDDVSPEDEALITKVVSKNFAPIIDKTLEADDEREIQTFLAENPEFKPFEVKVRRFIKHPSRRQLPVKSIFYEVAGDKLLKIGADRSRAADEKAKGTQTGGGSNRAGEGVKNDFDLTSDEFEAKKERVRQQGRQ